MVEVFLQDFQAVRDGIKSPLEAMGLDVEARGRHNAEKGRLPFAQLGSLILPERFDDVECCSCNFIN